MRTHAIRYYYKMLNVVKKICCLFAFIPFLSLAATNWKQLNPGLEYTELHPSSTFLHGRLHVFRINLADYKLKLASAKDFLPTFLAMPDFVIRDHASIGINGGFFSPQFQPLGLRIQDGKIINSIRPISWWDVFYIIKNKAHISSSEKFNLSKDISFALQCGPRLLNNRQIPKLKEGIDERSALGITKDGRIIIAVTEALPLSTTQLAEVLKAPEKNNGLNCMDAINLDGGSSTQLYAHINNFILNIPSYKLVADVVLVIQKGKRKINAKGF